MKNGYATFIFVSLLSLMFAWTSLARAQNICVTSDEAVLIGAEIAQAIIADGGDEPEVASLNCEVEKDGDDVIVGCRLIPGEDQCPRTADNRHAQTCRLYQKPGEDMKCGCYRKVPRHSEEEYAQD